jgi:predicted ATPase/DNA-binding winged helix-turn-helix (wHTH) protein
VDSPQAWQFGAFTLFPTQRLLLEVEAPVRVGGRALDILIVLVKAAGEVVSHDELMARVWQRVVVDEVSVRVHVASLRRVLGDDGETRRYIVNVPGRGYSFVGEVRSLALANAAKTHSSIERRARHLPPLLVQVIGRDKTIREVIDAVAIQRLVSIVGTGGIGKTTIALAAANQLVAHYRDGARVVDLAPLTDSKHVAVQVAHVVADTSIDAGEVDLESLLADRQMLIVLDNCEHVVQAVAAVTEAILQTAPGVRLIVTSREPIRAAGESVLRLSPLELPPASVMLSAQEALSFSAIQLFVQRTTATSASFVLTNADVTMVVDICRHLDGIPLAIELAAGRVAQLGLRGLSTRLTDRFSVLGKGRRTAVPRQQTLRATLDWSYELLSDEQKAILRRLSVFAGAFSFDSAVAVCEDDLSAETCDAIDELVLKSLISVDTSTDAVSYRLLEVTRAYALEKLMAAGELEAASRAHAQHVCNVFERRDADSLHESVWDAGPALWMDDIQIAAHASFVTLRDPALGMRLLAATASVWYQSSMMDEYQTWAEGAIEKAGDLADQPAEILMRMWYSLVLCYWYTKGPGPDLARAVKRTCAVSLRWPNLEFERLALWGLWAQSNGSGDYAEALGLARRRSALTPPGTEPDTAILSSRMMQWSLHLVGEQESSHQEATVALNLVSLSDRHRPLSRYQLDPQAATDAVRARALWIQGFPDQALAVAAEAVQSARSTQHGLTLCFALFGQCAVLTWCGRWEDLGRQADALIKAATERRLGLWKGWGQTYKDAQAFGAEGLVLPQWRRPVCGPLQLEFMATVSDELLELDALVRAEAGQCPWSAPEVLRAQGAKLLRLRPSYLEAEQWFVRAIDLARSTKAVSWELRATTSLSQCLLNQGRHVEANAMLTTLLDRYTEGFDTLDVQRARLLLRR